MLTDISSKVPENESLHSIVITKYLFKKLGTIGNVRSANNDPTLQMINNA